MSDVLHHARYTPTQAAIIERHRKFWASARPVKITEAEPVIQSIPIERVGCIDSTEWVFGPIVHSADAEDKSPPTLAEIISAACKRCNVTRADIKSERHYAHLVYARGICMFLCHTLTRHSYASIGRALGGRDHTTVIHAIRKIHGMLCAKNRNTEADIDALSAVLR